ncbi:hypothetical protein IF2G_07435 [Cordyceps javanica]|nr:hypothetical protein IF2G_07435 [Cordyceps javanica]
MAARNTGLSKEVASPSLGQRKPPIQSRMFRRFELVSGDVLLATPLPTRHDSREMINTANSFLSPRIFVYARSKRVGLLLASRSPPFSWPLFPTLVATRTRFGRVASHSTHRRFSLWTRRASNGHTGWLLKICGFYSHSRALTIHPMYGSG